MRVKLISGIAAGAILGATAGILLIPQIDQKTKKKIYRTSRRVSEFTGDLWDGIKSMGR